MALKRNLEDGRQRPVTPARLAATAESRLRDNIHRNVRKIADKQAERGTPEWQQIVAQLVREKLR
jgi:hypothetical protein